MEYSELIGATKRSERCCGAPSWYWNDGSSSSNSNNDAMKRLWKRRKPTQPRQDDAADDIEAQIVRELNAMPLEDREKMFEEVNGIPSTVDEDPEFVAKCLSQLDKQLEVVDVHQLDDNKSAAAPPAAAAYHLALSKNPNLRHDKQFQLMFLRSESFNVKLTAKRILKFFESKRFLFGDEKLVQPITYNDLDSDDKMFLATGSFQILPSKDQTGRSVLFVCTQNRHQQLKSWKSQFRVDWYLTMKLVENDQQAQQNGLVIIYYCVQCRTIEPKVVKSLANLNVIMDALPLRLVAIHFCYDLPQLQPLASFLQTVLNKEFRVRFRTHYGSHMECYYKLMAYGIRRTMLPLNSAGELQTTEFLARIEHERNKETASNVPKKASIKTKQQQHESNESVIFENEIRSNDVLLGKGLSQCHEGNQCLLNIIQSHRSFYCGASKFEKTCIAMLIVEKVKESKGRFLERRSKDSKEWYEVSAFQARRSIVHRFRSMMSHSQSNNNANNNKLT